MQDDSGNFNMSAESHRWRTSLVVLLLLFLAGLVFCTYKIWVDSARDKETISTIAKLRIHDMNVLPNAISEQEFRTSHELWRNWDPFYKRTFDWHQK